MCKGCYIEMASPSIVNERTQDAAKLIARVYEFSCVGGNAHIVLDDWNLEDHHVDWCLSDALTQNVHEAGADQLSAERACLVAMRALSMDERASALAIYEGFLHAP